MNLHTITLLAIIVLLFLSSPTSSSDMQPLLCAGSGGVVLGLGIGLGLGYLAFGYPWRNSGGVWLGRGGAGFWLPRGRKKRQIREFDNLEDLFDDDQSSEYS